MKSTQTTIALISSAVLMWAVLTGCGGAAPADTPTDGTEKAATVGNVVYAGYEAYSPDALATAQKEWKKTAVFFHSKTCGSCAKLEADIQANIKDMPDDVTVLKADWDENQELAKEHNVEKYHTVVYLGDAKKNVKGLFTLEDLVAGFSAPAPIKIAPKAE